MKQLSLTLATGLLIACSSESTSANPELPAESDLEAEHSSLTNTPISFAEAVGTTSKMIETGPCPFVSDEAIKASVRSNFEIVRRAVSNVNCRWSYNAGFSIDVTIENLATAKSIADRGYNIGVDTVLEPQSGPGVNATVVNDTAWDRPIPFAYSFEKDNKLVFMRYTGFKTSTEIMRPAANEIAERMNTAPVITSQQRQATQVFKPCEVWNDQDLKSVFGIEDTAVVAQGRNGMSTCNWKIYEDQVSGQKTAGFNIYKPEAGKKAEYQYDGYESYSDDGMTHYIRKSNSDFGLYIHIVTPRPEGLVHTTVSDPQKDATTVAKALQKNLLSRLVP